VTSNDDGDDNNDEEELIEVGEVIDLVYSPIARCQTSAANGKGVWSLQIESWDQLHHSRAAMLSNVSTTSRARCKSQRIKSQQQLHHSHVAMSSNTAAAANSRAISESQRQQQDVAMSSNAATTGRRVQRHQQWAYPRCTLLNNRDNAMCEACHHENPTRRNNNVHGRSNGNAVYNDSNSAIAAAMAATEGSIGDLGHGHIGTCAAAF